MWADDERAEDAQHLAEFRYIGGGDHAADGVKVFVGEAGARFIDFEAEKSADGKTYHCLRRV